ncbi:MAG: hypothetical protein JSS94_09020 [Bacteroidetes bacterium]|nr:hypothetical protein [Bacteroidota bacterium]
MKKVLLGAMLIAGTTLGFAKNQITRGNHHSLELETTTQNINSNTINVSKLILGEWCTDITYATAMIEQPDGSYSEEVISSCETTYPCINGGVRAYIICL